MLAAALLSAASALAAPSAQATPPACAPGSPAALALSGIPSVAIPGRSYTARLEGEGETVESAGADFSVLDTRGRGYRAHYEFARGVEQAFSVGLDGAPFTVSASWTEPGPCLRTVSVPLPIERRVQALVACRRGAQAPRSGLVLRCDGSRVKLLRVKWTGFNSDTAVGRGTLGDGDGRPATVTLSRPRECPSLEAFLYTRAKLRVDGRTVLRTPVDCPVGR
jgi:hypothetical protein